MAADYEEMTFVQRVKSSGFTGIHMYNENTVYPKYLGLDSRQDYKLRAYLFSYSGNKVNKILSEFLQSAGDEWVNTSKEIGKHPCIQSLKSFFPARGESFIDKNNARFVHYERVGVYWGERLIALAHIRHVFSCPINYSIRHHTDKDDNFGEYFLQLIDSWVSKKAEYDAVKILSEVIAKRAFKHLDQVDSQLSHNLDDIYGQGLVFLTISICKCDCDNSAILGPVMTNLLRYARPDVYGDITFPKRPEWSHMRVGSDIIVGELSEEDDKEIKKVLMEGPSVLRPKPLSRPAPGKTQLLFEIRDKSLVLTSSGMIGDMDDHVDGNPVLWRLLIDHGTSVFYAEPVIRDKDSVEQFFLRAWKRKKDSIFEGKPEEVSVPRTLLKKYAALDQFLSRNHVEMVHPSSGFTSGLAIARHWADSTYGACRGKLISYPELLSWSKEHQIIVHGNGWFKNDPREALYPGVAAMDKFGFGGEDHFGCYLKPDTQAFVKLVARQDAENLLMRQNVDNASDSLRARSETFKEDETIDFASFTPNYRLRVLRNLSCLTTEEFAPVLGFAKSSSIASLENGIRDLREAEIRKIASFFGVAEKWIGDGMPPMFAFGTGFLDMRPRNEAALLYVHITLRDNLIALFRTNGYVEYRDVQQNTSSGKFNLIFLRDKEMKQRLIIRIWEPSIYNTCLWVCRACNLIGETQLSNSLGPPSHVVVEAAKVVGKMTAATDPQERNRYIEQLFREFMTG